jgi:hypothetical protein
VVARWIFEPIKANKGTSLSENAKKKGVKLEDKVQVKQKKR